MLLKGFTSDEERTFSVLIDKLVLTLLPSQDSRQRLIQKWISSYSFEFPWISSKQREQLGYLVHHSLVSRVEIPGKRGTKDSSRNSAFFSRGCLKRRNDHCLVWKFVPNAVVNRVYVLPFPLQQKGKRQTLPLSVRSISSELLFKKALYK